MSRSGTALWSASIRMAFAAISALEKAGRHSPSLLITSGVPQRCTIVIVDRLVSAAVRPIPLGVAVIFGSALELVWAATA